MSEPHDPRPEEEGEGLASEEIARPLAEVPVNRRGSAGVFYVISWGFANLVITFLASLVLARLLSPTDFGLFAIGQTILMLAITLSEGGIAAGFVRKSDAIGNDVLRSINGVQLIIASAFAVAVTAIALPFGVAGGLAALVIWSLPISSLQTAGRIVLARELRFREVTLIEAVGVLANYGFAIAGVLLGYGVWSLAIATLVRAAVCTLMVGGIFDWVVLVPSLRRYRDVLGVIGFGIRFSVSGLIDVGYEQARNIMIASISGTYALGLWALVTRLLQIPNLVFLPLHRVAFPAFSQVIASGRSPGPALERVTRLSQGAATLTLPPFLVSVPSLIPVLFGEQWADAAQIFPGIILGLWIGQSTASPCIHFLFAMGNPAAVVRVKIVGIVISLASTAALLWMIGLPGIGLGTVPGVVFQCIAFRGIVRKAVGANVFSQLPAFLTASLLATGGGWLVLLAISSTVIGALVAAVASAAIALVACVLAERWVVVDLLTLGRRAVSSALAGEA